MNFTKYLTGNPVQFGGYMNWKYDFPNGHTASVITDTRLENSFRFEVLSSDPDDRGVGGVRAGLTSEQVEAKLAHLDSLIGA